MMGIGSMLLPWVLEEFILHFHDIYGPGLSTICGPCALVLTDDTFVPTTLGVLSISSGLWP